MGPRKNNNVLIFFVATMLAFCIGSGLGISMGITGDDFSPDEDVEEKPIFINVTKNISAYEQRENNMDYEYDHEMDFNESEGVQYTPPKYNETDYDEYSYLY